MKHSRNILPIALIIALMTLIPAVKGQPEVIFLKDGSLVHGTIARDAAAHITVRKEDKSTEKLLRKDIMRILYTKLYMGKVFVRMTDGKVLEAYKVDEDQDSYTFRKNLVSPEEFTVMRDKVMFIARSNPTDLEVKAEKTEIALKWSPPFLPPKSYNVYFKEAGSDFRLEAKPTAVKHVIKNLKSNSRYWTKVTAVDAEGVESMPTEELEALTKNFHPERPGKLSKKANPGGAMTLSWETASDRDGKVTGYRLYSNIEGKRTLVGETGKTAYTVQDAPRYKRVELVALDDRGDESAPAVIWLVARGLALDVSPGILYPMGSFGEMGGPGYGATVSFQKENVFLPGLRAGLEAGGFYLPGKDDLKTEGQETHRFYFVPFGIKLGYRLALPSGFSLVPSVTAGGAWFDLSYTSRDKVSLVDTEKSLKGLDPLALFTLDLEKVFAGNMYWGVGAGYGMLFESDKNLRFLRGGITVGMRF